jgi:hypothetical protein
MRQKKRCAASLKPADCSPSRTRSLIELSPIDSIFAGVGGFGKLIILDRVISKSYEPHPS